MNNRGTIVDYGTQPDIQDIAIPWKMVLPILRLHIISHLVKKGLFLEEAQQKVGALSDEDLIKRIEGLSS